jgi:hypothetical protein
MGFGAIVVLAICCLLVAGALYYYFYVAPQEQQQLPVHTPPYVQQVPVQQVAVAGPPTTVHMAPAQPQVYTAPAPAYAPNQVVYAQPPAYAAAPAYAAGPGPAPAPNGGGGMSGASVAVGAAAGLAGGLLVGGLIAGASNAHDSAPPDYCYEENDGVYAGDF